MPKYTCPECGHISKFDGRKVRGRIVLTNCSWGECQCDLYVDVMTGEIIDIELVDSKPVK